MCARATLGRGHRMSHSAPGTALLAATKQRGSLRLPARVARTGLLARRPAEAQLLHH